MKSVGEPKRHRSLLLLDLLHAALLRGLVGAPADEVRAVAETAGGEVVVFDLDDQLGGQRLPLGAALRRPPARPARRAAGEARGFDQVLQLRREPLALVGLDGGAEA